MRFGQQKSGLTLTRRGFLGTIMASTGLWMSGAARAAEAGPTVALANGVKCARITLSPGGDASREMGLAWRMDGPVETAAVQWAPSVNTAIKDLAFQTTEAAVREITVESGVIRQARARLTGLEPGKTYLYRVGDGSNWSPWYTFQTAGSADAPFSFLYVGDIQNDIRNQCAAAFQAAWRLDSGARFLVSAGDVVENGYDDALWSEVYDAMGYTPSWLPVLATPGNHDTRRHRKDEAGWGENTAHPLFNAHFTHPENGPTDVPELGNEAYFVDYQGARLVSLNANHLEESRPDTLSARCIDAQLAWLDRVLAEAGNAWKMVFFHQPVYSVAKGRDNAALRERLRPLFEKHGVHLVLQGHDHCYGRTFKCAGDRVVDGDAPGVIYVTTVLGPKLYDLGPKFAGLMAKQYDKTRSVQAIRVTPETLEYRSVGLDGTPLDHFVLRRGDLGALELREA